MKECCKQALTRHFNLLTKNNYLEPGLLILDEDFKYQVGTLNIKPLTIHEYRVITRRT